MPRYSPRLGMGLEAILAVLLVSSACSTSQSTPSPIAPGSNAAATGSPAASGDTTPTPSPVGTDGGAGTGVIELVFGDGPAHFPDTRAGLSELSSYKATLTLAFEGTRLGQPHRWSKTYVMLATTGPAAARQLTIEKTGDLATVEPVFMAERQGAGYARTGDASCVADPIVEGYSLRDVMEPAGFLMGVIGANDAGSEPFNGVAASHYTFDGHSLGQPDILQSTGEMWVASDGGYVLSYLLTTHGGADYFGEGTEGTLTSSYQLSDVNQALAIQLPEDCPAGMVDAPRLSDASDIVDVPGLISFTTASSMADAVDFYETELPALGWQGTRDPVIAEDAAWLEFTNDNQLLSVLITSADAGSSVDITLENK